MWAGWPSTMTSRRAWPWRPSPTRTTATAAPSVPAASATSLAFTGGRVAAGQTCTISVDVRALVAGMLTGRSSSLTSDLPVAALGALATLIVNEVPLSVSMSFERPVIRLTYMLAARRG